MEEKNLSEMSFAELRKAYPEVKAVSRNEFLKKLKAHLEGLKAAVGEQTPPPAPVKEEKPAETEKKAPADPEPVKEEGDKPKKAEKPATGLSECAAKYNSENKDFIEEFKPGRQESVIIVGSKRDNLFKVLLYKGNYGPTKTLYSGRGDSLETVRGIAKTLV